MARILVLNAGSSSLKASVLEPASDAPLAVATVPWGADATRAADRGGDLRRLLERFAASGVATESIAGVGHRVVHGGDRFRGATLVDDDVLDALDALDDLAPLHNPVAIETIRAARRLLPVVPHVACFDTAFHGSLDEATYRYPLPERWFTEWGVRRYGFHGLSVQWAVGRAARLLETPVRDLRLVVAHLGSGCSVTAVAGGRSVATSMGLTPLEGLMMGTRAGSIDPGVFVGLLRDGRLSLEDLAETLDHGAGLLAVAGTADMRALLAAEAAGERRAALAIRMFVLRAAAGIAAAATALPRLDALVFTGGIGEHAASIRARIVRRLAVLGLGRVSSRHVREDRILTPDGARPAVLRVEAREDLVIAAAAARAVEAARGQR